jgi:hypothetical protein
MGLRVVHWGVGQTGRHALQGIIGHPGLDLVGLLVQRPENLGKDAGELCERPTTGIVATNAVDDILALKPDCLSYFGPGGADGGYANIARFLEAGINVVTTSVAAMIHPDFAPEEDRRLLGDACAKGGASHFCTGIEPGYCSDLLPVLLLSATDRIDEVRVFELANYARYGVEHSQREVFGFGKPEGHVPLLFATPALMSVWGPVVRQMAVDIGAQLDDVRTWHEFSYTSRDLDTAFGKVEAGTVNGVRFAVEGMYGDRPIVAVEHVNFLSHELPDHWKMAQLGKDTVYRVEITGSPSHRCEVALDFVDGVEDGLIATAMRAINGIPAVVAAHPGLLHANDVPAVSGGNLRRR